MPSAHSVSFSRPPSLVSDNGSSTSSDSSSYSRPSPLTVDIQIAQLGKGDKSGGKTFGLPPNHNESFQESVRPRHELMRSRRVSMPTIVTLSNSNHPPFAKYTTKRLSVASNISYDSLPEDIAEESLPTSPEQESRFYEQDLPRSRAAPTELLKEASQASSFKSTDMHSSSSNTLNASDLGIGKQQNPNRLSLPMQPTLRRSTSPSPLGQKRLRTASSNTKRRSITRAVTEPLPRLSLTQIARGQKQSEKRIRLLQELVDTERSYVSTLTDIEENFLNPLLTALSSATPIIDKRCIQEIFSNFRDIVVLAREILRRLEHGTTPTEYTKREENVYCSLQFSGLSVNDPDNPPKSPIPAIVQTDLPGSLLFPLCPFLKCYSLFIQNFSRSLDRIHREEQINPEFREFLASRRKLGFGRGIDLSGMLLNVVQRIPRYRLLLNEVLLNMPSEHPDYLALTQSHEIIEQVAIFLDSSIKAHDATQKLLDLQKCFQGLENLLVAPGRKLLKKGTLVKVGTKGEQVRTFFLFSDVLLYATSSRPDDQRNMAAYRWSRALSINGLAALSEGKTAAFTPTYSTSSQADESPEQFYNPRLMHIKDVTVIATQGNYFEIRSSERSFAVADTAQIKREWIESLRSAKEEWLCARQTLQKESDDEAEEQQARLASSAGPSLTRNDSNLSGCTTPSLEFDSAASSRSIDTSPLTTPELGTADCFDHEAISRPNHTSASVQLVVHNYSAPVWVPDFKALSCMRCQQTFTILRRRHHCRLCGSVVCATCSENTFVIPRSSKASEQLARACDLCYSSSFPSPPVKRRVPPSSPTLADLASMAIKPFSL